MTFKASLDICSHDLAILDDPNHELEHLHQEEVNTETRLVMSFHVDLMDTRQESEKKINFQKYFQTQARTIAQVAILNRSQVRRLELRKAVNVR